MTERRLPPALRPFGDDHGMRLLTEVQVLDWLYGKDVPVYVDDVFAGRETSPGLVERVEARAKWVDDEGFIQTGAWKDALRAELGEEA